MLELCRNLRVENCLRRLFFFLIITFKSLKERKILHNTSNMWGGGGGEFWLEIF